MEVNFHVQLSDLIRKTRKEAKLSRFELARLSDVGKTALYDLEHGKNTVQLDTLLKVLKTLNIRLDIASPFNEKVSAP